MDKHWERSFAMYMPTEEELAIVFKSLQQELKIKSIKGISLGCRNSNYQVTTTVGDFLVRVCPEGDSHHQNEAIVFSALSSKVAMPKLLNVLQINNRNFMLYEYIPAVSLTELQNEEARTSGFDVVIIEQVARNAAIIHNTMPEEVSGLVAEEIPPFAFWFKYFLSNERTIQRLGLDLTSRVEQLVASKQVEWEIIDSYQSFIHNDFRPANMLLKDGNTVYIVDWEACGFGHTLADIGEFFRYRHYFSEENIKQFDDIYHKYANRSLPNNWFDLSKLRDLANYLQMLGMKQELPNKYEDLKRLTEDTVIYFEDKKR